MLWHRVTELDPPMELINHVHKAFVDFFRMDTTSFHLECCAWPWLMKARGIKAMHLKTAENCFMWRTVPVGLTLVCHWFKDLMDWPFLKFDM